MDDYREGYKAAFDSKEHWENPHAVPLGSKERFSYWYAGWCSGKQDINNGVDYVQTDVGG